MLLEQFDEYQALVVQQRAPGDPRPLFQLSQGPAPVAFNVLPNGSAPYVGTNFGSRNVTWMDPQSAPRIRNELEYDDRIPDQRQ